MSWNSNDRHRNTACPTSASSWGCELKYFKTSAGGTEPSVSLFVRLWVEMFPCACISPQTPVSLFVRLWVEMDMTLNGQKLKSSASSWGCELKYMSFLFHLQAFYVSLFVRLWVEIVHHRSTTFRQELVSLFVRLWVEITIVPTRSWSAIVSLFVRLWVEISICSCSHVALAVSLFVRLWVEITGSIIKRIITDVSLFVRLWVEIAPM